MPHRAFLFALLALSLALCLGKQLTHTPETWYKLRILHCRKSCIPFSSIMNVIIC